MDKVSRHVQAGAPLATTAQRGHQILSNVRKAIMPRVQRGLVLHALANALHHCNVKPRVSVASEEPSGVVSQARLLFYLFHNVFKLLMLNSLLKP